MIRDRGVALRYVNALFGASEKRGLESKVLADLESIDQIEGGPGPSLQNFLESPSVLDEHKESVTRTVLGGRVEELTVQFVLLMLRKKRIQHLPLVLAPFRRLVETKLGMAHAELVTAVPVDDATVTRMREQLEALTGKKVAFEKKVDPAILGGAVVTLEGRVLDSSLRYQLRVLREDLLATQVVN